MKHWYIFQTVALKPQAHLLCVTAYIHGNTMLSEYCICDAPKNTEIQKEKCPYVSKS